MSHSIQVTSMRGESAAVSVKELEECYREPGNQLVVLYGRTDSEKERLLGAFVQNKKHFYYRARQVAEREQRAQMGRELAAQFEVTPQKYTYEEYFNRVKSGDPTKLVVVIDEFQYIAKKDPTFMEAVLKLKAHRLYPGPVMILLCSSAVSWAERELTECIGHNIFCSVFQISVDNTSDDIVPIHKTCLTSL